MNIEYTQYEDKYYNDLKKITLTSFKLTSFHTDWNIPSEKSNIMAWEIWCRPVLESDKKKYCIVAIFKGSVIGYIIYGADAEISRVINKKTGNIILLAVDVKFQGKYHIARNLVKYVLDIYRKYGISIVSTGTDQDNLPGMINYINNGFQPVLFWSTFRWYFKANNNIKKNKNVAIIKKDMAQLKELKNISRPFSFLLDNNFDKSIKRKLDSYIKKMIVTGVKKKQLELYEIKYKKQVCRVTIVKEMKLSEILEMDTYRINDIILFQNNYSMLDIMLKDFLFRYSREKSNLLFIETFINSNNWRLKDVLVRAGFIDVHSNVTLHNFL